MIPDWMRRACPDDCLRCEMELEAIIRHELMQDQCVDIEITEQRREHARQHSES